VPDSTPYLLQASSAAVEVWSVYQIQFDGMRRHDWQAGLVGELKAALSGLAARSNQALTGTYATSLPGRCDAENRLFTNPGTATFPPGTLAIRWERGTIPPPSPEPMADLGAGVHYYRYAVEPGFQVWAPDREVASWADVPRAIADDGSARPMWLALRSALVDGFVTLPAESVPEGSRFGLSLTLRAPMRGPRSAPALSEAIVDGVLCALHAGAPDADSDRLSELLAARLPTVPREGLSELVRERPAVFGGSPFLLGGRRIQLSPCDEFCDAGEVVIQPDPAVSTVHVSGRAFTLRPQPGLT
jgi:hypothetical protein